MSTKVEFNKCCHIGTFNVLPHSIFCFFIFYFNDIVSDSISVRIYSVFTVSFKAA